MAYQNRRPVGLLNTGRRGGLLASASMPADDELERLRMRADATAPVGPASMAGPPPGQSRKGLLAREVPAGMSAVEGGLLSSGKSSARMNEGGTPITPPPASAGGPSIWGVLDDVLFGGAMSANQHERRQRANEQAFEDAHRQAYARAVGPDGLDVAAYERELARMGQAPSYDDMMGLEQVAGSRSTRGRADRTERREVQGGALAPLMGMDPEARAGALPAIGGLLKQEGFPMGIDPSQPGAVEGMVGAAMGPNAFLDNRRGDLALDETRRSNLMTEGLRGHANQIDEFQARETQRHNLTTEEIAVRREARQAERDRIIRSTGQVIGPVLQIVAEQGPEALSPGQAQIFESWQRQGDSAGIMQMLMGLDAEDEADAEAASQPRAVPQQRRPAPGAQGAGPQGLLQTPAAPQGNGTPQAPAMPQTPEDFERLPAGAYYIDPGDGQLYQKAR